MGVEAVVADDGGERASALDEMRQLLAAAQALRADLEVHETACRLIIERIGAGHELAPALDEIGSQDLRPQLTRSLSAYERLRHRARLRLIALGVAEGMTSGDIQRHWAITRQLAGRALQEIRELDLD